MGVAVVEEGVGEFTREGGVVGGLGLGHEEGADGGAALAAVPEGAGEEAEEGWVLVASGGEEGGGVLRAVCGEEGCGEAGEGGRVVGAGGEAAFPDVQGLLRHSGLLLMPVWTLAANDERTENGGCFTFPSAKRP